MVDPDLDRADSESRGRLDEPLADDPAGTAHPAPFVNADVVRERAGFALREPQRDVEGVERDVTRRGSHDFVDRYDAGIDRSGRLRFCSG